MWASFSQWLVILLIILILFGGDKIPKLAEDLGKSLKAFRRGMTDEESAKPVEPKPTKEKEESPKKDLT